MGKYSVVADVGQHLVNLLAEQMVPDLLSDKNAIGLCGPDDHGDITLGLYLYDIKENEDVKINGMVDFGIRGQKFPPKLLSLYYMITAYSSSDIKFRAVQEHRILGKVIQVFNDNSVIPYEVLGNTTSGMDMKIEMVDLTTEEKMKLWNDQSKPYKLSVCYKVAPVELESEKTRKVTRVREIQIGLASREGR